jgi:hypothetical protein
VFNTALSARKNVDSINDFPGRRRHDPLENAVFRKLAKTGA